ncbi:hypothetical protein CYY_001132 [Polysphondylium violaceum]|uniref:alpha-1,2-Mannosidase n=1 Tax=Polysphondylium violaceum TaxID=133409 RepID=A0A8J4Q9S2_9MYCE|nr:hypothetical protein CYY_001132 [Polysphondylium violaceum]
MIKNVLFLYKVCTVFFFIIVSLCILKFDGGKHYNDPDPTPINWRNIVYNNKTIENENNIKEEKIKLKLSIDIDSIFENIKNEKQKQDVDGPLNRINYVYRKNERINIERAEKVKDAMKHAWDNYVKYAWGQDELRPMASSYHNWFGLGLTIIDSLDTLLIMEMKDEFIQAREWVESINIDQDNDYDISVFEANIRLLGGFLSTYHLTNDSLFLDKAIETGNVFLNAFEDDPFPKQVLNFFTKKGKYNYWSQGCTSLAEVGTLFLEFYDLSETTGNPIWKEKADIILDTLTGFQTKMTGLIPTGLIPDGTGFCDQRISVGSSGDSYYEYLLKMWIYYDGKQDKFKQYYMQASDSILRFLYKRSNGNTYFVENIKGKTIDTQEHLACFASGMIALGAGTNIANDKNSNQLYMKLAHSLVKTCVDTYYSTPSGLAPDSVDFDPVTGEIKPNNPSFFLRPETIESLFILYRLTGNTIYQEWGWTIFESINQHCRVDRGFVGLRNTSTPELKDDLQQSFFMAETLKYLYLLYSDSNVIPLSQYVFNTEAHPIPIRKAHTSR